MAAASPVFVCLDRVSREAAETKSGFCRLFIFMQNFRKSMQKQW